MADFTTGPNGAGAGSPIGLQGSLQAGKYVNIAAAAVSVAMIGGVGIWGYKLLMRDVTGVPVVRAMAGDMRVAPENPGGEIASNIGLSVNSVPADGGAAEPEDRLVLAPSGTGLQAEDMNVTPVAEAAEVVAAPEIAAAPAPEIAAAVQATLTQDEAEAPRLVATATPVDPSTPLTAEDVLALADQIAAGAAPLGALAEGETAPIAVAVNGVTVDPNVIPDAVPGVRRSLRPAPRPASRPAVAAATAQPATPVAASVATPAVASTAAPAGSAQVSTATLPVGTKLVQLGAFDSPEIAASEWVRLTGQFPDFFQGKSQVIQQATSGGRTFFRLRAQNFADLSDARRFCATMSAEGAPCIPVVVR